MIEIWQECARVQTTRRPSQDNNKERLFSDLEILEKHQKINNEQDSDTISDTPSIKKQKKAKPKWTVSENRNNTQPNNVKPKKKKKKKKKKQRKD